MRASLVLEPAVLAMPALANDEQSITQSIATIIQLSEALRASEFNICLLSEAESLLAQANLYPVSNSIRQSLANSGLSHVYTVEDIRRSLHSILQQSHRLEEISGIEFLIPADMQTVPDVLANREPFVLRESLEITLAHASLMTEQYGRSNVQALLADQHVRQDIELRANISDIYTPIDGPSERPNFCCLVALSDSPASFLDQLDGDALWSIADSESEIFAAVCIKARSLRRSTGCPSPKQNCEGFSIGKRFVPSMKACQCGPNEKYGFATFETLARVVAKSPLEAPKRLYQLSSTGHRIDVVREDGAIAWRLHVTKSGEGIRLMFWRRRDTSLEFANVGTKADVSIG